MNTVSSLLDQEWYERYKQISRLNIRSSIYDVTNRCNLRCKGCFFFSSGEHKVAKEEMSLAKWETFVDGEKNGVLILRSLSVGNRRSFWIESKHFIKDCLLIARLTD